MTLLRRAALALLILLAVSPVFGQTQLVVYAASSLTDAFEQIASEFEAANPGVDVLFNFGGSSELAAQLREGAPADVFASANARQMRVAREAGRIAGTPRTFAKNRLVLIVPADNPAGIAALRDLAAAGMSIVVAAEGVPVRDYTNTLLDRLAADPAYGEAYRAAFMANVVSEEPNVRQVAAKVAFGEADAGLVYASDVTPDISDEVIALAIPDDLNTIAAYPIAVTDDAAAPELAQAFVDFVLSDRGQAILVSWNFLSARIPELPATVTLASDPRSFTVDGQVLNPLTLDAASVQANFGAVTLDVMYQSSGSGVVDTQFTGALLWQIINAAQPNFNADVEDDKLSTYLVVTVVDGAQVVVAWAEIDPDYGNQPILVAYAENGQPFADADGAFRLVVPNDRHGGRSLRGVANISLRDAPQPAP